MSESCPRCGFSAPKGALSVCPRCLLTAEQPEAVDFEVPGLAIQHEIGRGGMAVVYLATHVRLGRDVAVKVLAHELGESPEFRARFEREARALARLSHPHIVTVYDFGVTSAGQSYLVMEYVPGGTLAERIPAPHARALEIALQICEALAEAHARGIVHRDLKPENVLFDAAERVKLADFGIARLLDAESGDVLTHPALVAGTPRYMAPEARAGAAPDPRMDIFALGVLLRELTAGRFEAPVPPLFRSVVERATEPSPERRYGTAKELRRALAALDRASSATAELLPPEEQSWQRAVALAFTAATAVGLYALVTSFTPAVLDTHTPPPLLVLGTRRLPDGRVLALSQFQTWPMLAGAAAFAVALASYGMLRRHWRTAGFDRPAPDRPLPSSKTVLWVGAGLFAAFGVHRLLQATSTAGRVVPYLPVFGGTFEFLLLYLVWLSILEAIRTERPLRREARLWVGLALGLVPPTTEFVRSLDSF